MGSIKQIGFNDFDSAVFYYKKSLDIAQQNRLPEHIATAEHNLGGIYKDMRLYDQARPHLQKALEISRKLKRYNLVLGTYRTLAELYVATGDYKNAYLYKNMQLNLRDSIFQEEKHHSVMQLEARYQAAKKDELIQRQKLQAEKENRKYNTVIFISLLLLLAAVATAIYFWQRKKSKEKLEREKSKIYHNIVHEIRTPLTLINGPLQQIKKKLNDADSQEDIQLIERNSGRLVFLVNELLDASRLENGQFKINYQYGNPLTFTADVLESFRNEAVIKKQNLVIKAAAIESSFEFPANVIEKVVTNLVGNAIKYTQQGGEIKVEIKSDDDRIEITVSDNGPGIPLNEQPKIFDRFYRGKAHINLSGTGIGLSMVKELTELCGGTVALASMPGRGTTVHIVLPVKTVSDAHVVDEINDDKPCILLVEDDEDVAAFTEKTLRSTFTVIKASNGKEGLEKCRTSIPDILLTDVMMPVMDGIELISEIKKDEKTRHIPTIIFSAKGSAESRLQGLQSGADGYLPKPFNPDELKLLVNNILNTVLRNQKEYQQGLNKEVPFKERLSGGNVYLGKIIDQIEAHLENPEYSVNELADDMCVSRSQLHRNIKSITGHSTTYLIKLVRIEKAKDMLKTHAGNITEIAYACGFASQSYFTRTFTEMVGVPPSVFVKS